MTFCKLDSGIVKSSLWSSPLETRILFITMLAIKDESGFVECSRTGLIRMANISAAKFDISITELESPDPDSKSTEFEGRRIDKVEGGWIVLNHEKYRLPEQVKKSTRNEYMREYMRKKREKSDVNTNKKLTPVNSELTSVSVSKSVSKSESERKFDEFRKKYPGSKRGNSTEYENFCKKHRDHSTVLHMLLPALDNQSSWRMEMSRSGQFVPEWKNLQTWINQRYWELEKPTIQETQQRHSSNDCGYQEKML